MIGSKLALFATTACHTARSRAGKNVLSILDFLAVNLRERKKENRCPKLQKTKSLVEIQGTSLESLEIMHHISQIFRRDAHPAYISSGAIRQRVKRIQIVIDRKMSRK